ncbi:N-acetylglutamate kinase [Nocardiopsis sp. Huas11]|uniref:[LysW]-aminoadipate kinase n=1 Tax=Nocardiopsis sp. Huas11 TaxID=2183912 RepID=UPI000F232FB1|nr:[LysW]-aminoadipate kinase [Nocardiopsis sp. Huas11]RKS08409.1 N-acetylglutamate kinase [Nocardiopsis sp. Huas11]
MEPILTVKCGGHGAVAADRVCADVAALAERAPVVLVHGGSAEIERLSGRLGVPSRQIRTNTGITSRHTDDATLDVLLMAFAGVVKPRLVNALQRSGADAVGLTGLDGGLLRARRKFVRRAGEDGRRYLVRDDRSGRVTAVRERLLQRLLEEGIVPVVSPPALADDGPVNVDADRAAAAVAVALGSPTLVMLTGVPGVLSDPSDEGTALQECAVGPEGAPPFLGGGMGRKLIAAREALAGGVGRVLISDGRVDRPVYAALEGAGTEITLDQVSEPPGRSRP